MSLPFPEYEAHDAIALAELVSRGEISPDELLDAAVARCDERNPTLNAVVVNLEKEARAAIAAGLPAGPLRGVPYLLKDLYMLLEGAPITNGSRLYAGSVPDHDSELVRRYKQAGLVIFGRTASPEFGLTATTESVLHGDTRNPWLLEHTPGGSSGGASAAVAAGILPVAHATDGGGSIRIPASCCGLFGLKPTRGRTPFGPDQGEGWSGMSCGHVVSRSVRDSALLLDATHGPEPGMPYRAPEPPRPYLEEVGIDPGRLRIGVVRTPWNGAPLDPDCVAAIDAAVALLEGLGHEVEDNDFDVDYATLGQATGVLMAANLRANVEDRLAELGRELRDDDLESTTRLIYESVVKRSAEDYARAVRRIHRSTRDVDAQFERFDILLSTTMTAPPLPLGRLSLSRGDLDAYGEDIATAVGFTQLFNASGHPAASVPLHWNAAGLPIGIQLAGRFGDEGTLFRLAGQLEQAAPWFDRRPPTVAG